MGGQADLGIVFQRFHAVVGGDQVAAHGQRTVVLQKQHVMLRQEGRDRIWHFVGGGRAVGRDGDGADGDDRFDHAVVVQRLVGHGKARSRGRMGVHHRAYVLPDFVAAHVHFHFAGGLVVFRAFHYVHGRVHPQQLIGGNKGLADSRGRDPVGAILHFDGYVAVVGGYPAQLPHFVAYVADLILDFLGIHQKSPHLFADS